MFETIRLETDARGVATLTLNRPERHNAMNQAMIAELAEAARLLAAGPARAVVLTGVGESFCAGGDLDWMRAQFGATREARMAQATALAQTLKALNELPKPLIGRMQGQAYGGGVGLVSICDSVVAVEGSLMGLTETRLGLVPATISPYVLARMGDGNARRVFMSARRFPAEEGVRLGLVTRAVAREALDAAVEAEIAPYLAAAPGAVGRAKALIATFRPAVDDATIARTAAVLADAWETTEAQEGVAAFFDRRKANWVV